MPSFPTADARPLRPPRVVLVTTVLALVATMVLGASPEPARGATGDPVIAWNEHATDALIVRAGQSPQESIPHLAMVHGAVYDAVNAIVGGHQGYLLDPAVAPSSASLDAAVAAAAHDVLIHLLPDQAAILDGQYAAAVAGLRAGPDRDAGVAVGRQAAAAMVAERRDDGRYGTGTFTPSTDIGAWRPELPAFVSDPNAWLKDVRPFLVRSAQQFHSRPPPGLRSRRWARDLEEVRAFGGQVSTVRTAEQEQAARYWAMNPPAIWSRILRQVAVDHDLAVPDDARLFAQAYLTAADSLITVWHSKDRWSFWRPITAIPQADRDGNRWTTPEQDWLPLLPTPPYPEHPSGHLGLSGAMLATMRDFFGTDAVSWTDTNAAGTRSTTSLSTTLEEIVGARIWSGIHFRTADEEGDRIARRIARWRRSHWFRPRPNTALESS